MTSFTLLTRTTMALSALVGIGVMASAEGCGPGDTRYYCDTTGCYTCDGYGCHPTTPPANTACTGDKACAQNQICTSQGCETTCKADTDCPQGDVCKNNLCVAPTANPGNPVACTTNADCLSGQSCVGTGSSAFCTNTTNACTYSSECPSGEVCADGECLGDCSKGQACAAGTACVKGVCEPNGTGCNSNAQCSGATPVCLQGSCVAECDPTVMPTTCAPGLVCEQVGSIPTQGACVPQSQVPQPNCGSAAQCLSNQECLDGFCRYTCTYSGSVSSPSMQCELIDTRIEYCAKDGTCRDAQEAQAQCLDASDCTNGQMCVSNQCQ